MRADFKMGERLENCQIAQVDFKTGQHTYKHTTVLRLLHKIFLQCVGAARHGFELDPLQVFILWHTPLYHVT